MTRALIAMLRWQGRQTKQERDKARQAPEQSTTDGRKPARTQRDREAQHTTQPEQRDQAQDRCPHTQHAGRDEPSTAPESDRHDTTRQTAHEQERGRNKRQAEHRNEPASSAKSHKKRHEEKTRAADEAADGDAKKGTGSGANNESTHDSPAEASASTNGARPTPVANNKRGRLRERQAQNYDETKRRKTTKTPRPRAARERVAAQHLDKHRNTGQLRRLIQVGKRVIDRADQQEPRKKSRRGQVYDDMG